MVHHVVHAICEGISRGGKHHLQRWLSHRNGLLVLHLFSIVLLTGLLVAVLVQGFKSPSSPGNEKIYKQLMQLKVGVDSLCLPCPWEWESFNGKCYFFSKSQRTWNDSVTACQEVEAQLVIIDNDEEQSFLQRMSEKKGHAWMGLSDIRKEGKWVWMDGSPLQWSFMKYWNKGEPNNEGEEDCAEFRDDGWNDAPCAVEKYWICKKSAMSCTKN
ncbi:CD209 antigen-like protein C [Microtus ochrogaster]|uniref:CD209 antigen-like protein C n=1 Tax=Microtus ochrogaster TaxID=79684 RepID=A0ABM1USL5_MICOH|nr:CD209 antigen-like protein C [Microtus ochrogaster]